MTDEQNSESTDSELRRRTSLVERALVLAKEFAAFTRRALSTHGIYEVGLAKGAVNGLQQALGILKKPKEPKDPQEPKEYRDG